jgi:heme-degrading monooxygenase HmoA
MLDQTVHAEKAQQHESESLAMSAVRYLEGGSDVAVLSVTVQQLRKPCTRYVVFTHWRSLLHIVHAA